MNYVKKPHFALILYTKSHFGAIFGPTCMYKKLRNFRTVSPGVTNLVSKCAGKLERKKVKVSRRELCALQSNRAKCRGGGGPFRPPGPVFLGLKGVHNGRTMLSYIQEHIVCTWKQFKSAWKSIWVLRYCKKYDALFCFFGHLSVSQFQFLKLGHDPWSIVTK